MYFVIITIIWLFNCERPCRWHLPLGQGQVQHPVLHSSLDAIHMHITGQRKTTLEITVAPLDKVVRLAFFILDLLALARDGQMFVLVVNVDLDVLLCQTRQLACEGVLLVSLGHIEPRSPQTWLVLCAGI